MISTCSEKCTVVALKVGESRAASFKPTGLLLFVDLASDSTTIAIYSNVHKTDWPPSLDKTRMLLSFCHASCAPRAARTKALMIVEEVGSLL